MAKRPGRRARCRDGRGGRRAAARAAPRRARSRRRGSPARGPLRTWRRARARSSSPGASPYESTADRRQHLSRARPGRASPGWASPDLGGAGRRCPSLGSKSPESPTTRAGRESPTTQAERQTSKYAQCPRRVPAPSEPGLTASGGVCSAGRQAARCSAPASAQAGEWKRMLRRGEAVGDDELGGIGGIRQQIRQHLPLVGAKSCSTKSAAS